MKKAQDCSWEKFRDTIIFYYTYTDMYVHVCILVCVRVIYTIYIWVYV